MPTLERLLNGISRQIKLHSKNVKILETPTEFRDTLLSLSASIKHRSLISSLYVGSGKAEQEIVSNLARAANTDNCDVSLVLDYYRARRDGGRGLKELRNTAANVHLYRTPHWNYYLPHQVGEMLGVHHMKYYTFDDNVILSGANLSELYFGPRQDRYYVIKSRHVSDYLSYVHDLYINNAAKWKPMSEIGHFRRETFWNEENMKVATRSAEIFSCNTPIDIETRDLGPADGDTSFFPFFQINWHCINQIDDSLDFILQVAKPAQEVTLSSGYFNPSKRLIKSLCSTKANVRIIIPSCRSNGFYQGAFVKGLVPDLYNLSALKTLKACPNIEIIEYEREDWSYHGKGVWVDNMTIIGSSNFNRRSSARDTEFSAAVVTKNLELVDQFYAERDRLSFYSRPLQKQYHFVAPLGFRFMASYL